MPRVESARFIERPALTATFRISGRRSKISVTNPRAFSEIASSGPARPEPTRVMLDFVGIELLGLAQHSPRFPDFRKEFLVEREPQVRRARAASGAHLHADGAFHHLDMPQSPTDDELVKLCQPLAHIDPIAKVAFVLVNISDRRRACLKSVSFGCIGSIE